LSEDFFLGERKGFCFIDPDGTRPRNNPTSNLEFFRIIGEIIDRTIIDEVWTVVFFYE
jgi:hypothetical protein